MFECSRLPIVSFLLTKCRSCLIILRFALKSAKVGNLFFTHEVIFPAITSLLRHPFGVRRSGPASCRDIEGNNCHVGGTAFGGRPLHPSETDVGGCEKIF